MRKHAGADGFGRDGLVRGGPPPRPPGTLDTRVRGHVPTEDCLPRRVLVIAAVRGSSGAGRATGHERERERELVQAYARPARSHGHCGWLCAGPGARAFGLGATVTCGIRRHDCQQTPDEMRF